MADPITIAAVTAAVAAVGTGMQVVGQIQQGKAADKAARYEAQQREVNAGQVRASSQRTAIERKRQSTLLASRAQAIGASGGGGLDPSTIDIISDIDAEGEYGALSALYQGDEVARGNIAQANVGRFEGKQAKQAGYYNAAGTTGSFFAKYGSDIFGQSGGATSAPAYSPNQYGPYQLPWQTG